MQVSIRIFLGYFVLLGIAIRIVMRSFSQELVPGMRQSLEEMLVDTANLLAEVVHEEVAAATIADGEFAQAMVAFGQRRFDAVIWFLQKRDSNLIVYITDASGIVLYDSRGRDVGKDYSRWNDVYLTLQGQYGARSSREDENDEFSSIMYVAAPIRAGGQIIGALTVGKPSVAVQPFIEAALRNVRERGIWVMLAALLVGAAISHWLTLSMFLLYAMLYAILRSEDNALLMGSLLLFGVLALVMTATRHLDWYRVAERMGQQTVHIEKTPESAPSQIPG